MRMVDPDDPDGCPRVRLRGLIRSSSSRRTAGRSTSASPTSARSLTATSSSNSNQVRSNMELNARQKQEIADNGYVHVPGVVPPLMVEAALRAINHSVGQGMNVADMNRFRAQSYCPEIQNTPPITDLLKKTPAWDLAESVIGRGPDQAAGRRADRAALPFPGRAGAGEAAPGRDVLADQWRQRRHHRQLHDAAGRPPERCARPVDGQPQRLAGHAPTLRGVFPGARPAVAAPGDAAGRDARARSRSRAKQATSCWCITRWRTGSGRTSRRTRAT